MNVDKKRLVEIYAREIVNGEVWNELIIRVGKLLGYNVTLRGNEIIAVADSGSMDEELDNVVKIIYEQGFSDYREKKLIKHRLYRSVRRVLLSSLASLAPKIEETLANAKQKYGLTDHEVHILKKLLVLHVATLAKLTAGTLWKLSICEKVVNDPTGHTCLQYALLDMRIRLEDLDFEELLDKVLKKVKPKN